MSIGNIIIGINRGCPPPRKEPGLVAKAIGGVIQLILWLFVSLLVSIAIEWMGMTWFWADQGANHAKAVLSYDRSLLNEQLFIYTSTIRDYTVELTFKATDWVSQQAWLRIFDYQLLNNLKNQYDDYITVISYVAQIFFIRLTLIFFSLPIFAVALLMGFIDGLAERELRRWGGGRESSNVFNLARRSVLPAFAMACVIYISLPFSINPALVMLPFAALLFFSIRVTMERLKKYF